MKATMAPGDPDDGEIPGETPDLPAGADLDAVLDADAEAAADKLSENTVMAAYQLKVRGASYHEIAQLLEYMDAATARAAVHRAIASLADPEDDGKALRQLESARIEAVMKAVAPRAIHRIVKVPSPTGEVDQRTGKTLMIDVENTELLPHATLFLKAVEQHSRLHGVVAPQQLQLLTPDALELERTVTAMVAIANREEAKEADIFFEEDPAKPGTFHQKPDEEDGDAEETAAPVG